MQFREVAMFASKAKINLFYIFSNGVALGQKGPEMMKKKFKISILALIVQPHVHTYITISSLLYSLTIEKYFEAPLQHMCLTSLSNCIKNCSIVSKQ